MAVSRQCVLISSGTLTIYQEDAGCGALIVLILRSAQHGEEWAQVTTDIWTRGSCLETVAPRFNGHFV